MINDFQNEKTREFLIIICNVVRKLYLKPNHKNIRLISIYVFLVYIFVVDKLMIIYNTNLYDRD